MAQIIQSGTATFSNPFGSTASVDVTFPVPFADTNVAITATPQLTGYPKNYQVTISFDATTLTTTGVTFNVKVGGDVIGKYTVGTLDFDWQASSDGDSGSPSTYTHAYTAADFTAGSLTINKATHGCGNGPFLIQFLDDSSPANVLEAQYTVNLTNGQIIITDPAGTGYNFTIIMSSI